MKGMMFWDYDGDDNQGTLRNALWNAVMQEDKDAQLHDFINNSHKIAKSSFSRKA